MKEREIELLQKVLKLTKTRQSELPEEDPNLRTSWFNMKEHQADFSQMNKDITDTLQKSKIKAKRKLIFHDIPQGRLTAIIEVELNNRKLKILTEHFPKENKKWYFVQISLNTQLTKQEQKDYLQRVIKARVSRVERESGLDANAKITITEKGELAIEREVIGKKKTIDFVVKLIAGSVVI